MSSPQAFDVQAIRKDFPILDQQIRGRSLVYLDSAASAQKPRQVLDAIRQFDASDYSNVHRGVHTLSQRATEAYEAARESARRFLNAAKTTEIIFTRGTTEAINLVVSSYGQRFIKEGDEIVITHMEHHSNIVPWQMFCERTGAVLKVIPINDAGELVMEEARRLIGPKTRMVALVHVSNALGTINPVEEIIELAHAQDAAVMLDGAQAVPHLSVDVQALGCDFYAFSGHKLFGPTGIGVLYGRESLLNAMPPYQGGGEMISSVTFDKTVFNELPAKFEAGTPNITGAVGLGAAIEYFEGLDLEGAAAHEHELLVYASEALAAIPAVRLVGTASNKASVVSFVIDNIHPHDVGTILDQEGIAVRVGHHCAQPVMDRYQIPATVRASLAIYNTKDEIDRLVAGIQTVLDLFG